MANFWKAHPEGTTLSKTLFRLLVCGITLFLFDCNRPQDQPRTTAESVTFYHVPMVCNAAPSIGCGSRAKFVMLDLMKNPSVSEAWLNRKGTVIAAVWRKDSKDPDRQVALKTVFDAHDLAIDEISDSDIPLHAQGFDKRQDWYKGADVDKLSIEEAGVIADRLVAAVSIQARFKTESDQKAFREEVRGIMQNCFLKLNSFEELDDENTQDIQRQIYLTAVKYIGKDNVPKPEVLREEYQKLQDKECATMEESGACCSKHEDNG